MTDYSTFTKEGLIAEIERLKKYYRTLVLAIIHHNKNDSDNVREDRREELGTVPD